MTSFENSKKGDLFVITKLGQVPEPYGLYDMVCFESLHPDSNYGYFKFKNKSKVLIGNWECISIPKELENESIETIKLWAAL